MKHVVLLFLFVCLKIAGGHSCAYASLHKDVICHAPHGTISNQSTSNANVLKKHYQLAERIDIGEEDVTVIGVEDEDESEDIIKRHSSLVRYSLAFNHIFIAGSHNLIAERTPSCKYPFYSSSCKYIIQRALRI